MEKIDECFGWKNYTDWSEKGLQLKHTQSKTLKSKLERTQGNSDPLARNKTYLVCSHHVIIRQRGQSKKRKAYFSSPLPLSVLHLGQLGRARLLHSACRWNATCYRLGLANLCMTKERKEKYTKTGLKNIGVHATRKNIKLNLKF